MTSIKSETMKENIVQFIKISTEMKILMFPTFEIKDKRNHFHPKLTDIQQMVKNRTATSVEGKLIAPTWLLPNEKNNLNSTFDDNTTKIDLALDASPYFLAMRTIPMLDERFVAPDYDLTHLYCELYVANYSFHVSNSDFFYQYPHTQENNNDPELKMKNWFLFNYHFKDELENKYKNGRNCQSKLNTLQNDTNSDSQNRTHNLSLSWKPLKSFSNEFVRYDIQRNQMSDPVRLDQEFPFNLTGQGHEGLQSKSDLKSQARKNVQKKEKEKKKKPNVMTIEDMLRKQQMKPEAAIDMDKLSFE